MSKLSHHSNQKFKKSLIEQHNILRSNPTSYIPLLEQHLKYFKGNILQRLTDPIGIETEEGPHAVRECIDFLKIQKAVQELKLDERLSRAAQDHADDMGKKGLTDHTGSDGSSPDDRISKYLEWDVTMAENLDFGSSTAEDVLISLIIDDGVANRGHRKNIFNPRLNYVGVGFALHTQFSVCTVINYCGDIVRFKEIEEDNSNKESNDRLTDKIFLGFIERFFKGAKNRNSLPVNKLIEDSEIVTNYPKPSLNHNNEDRNEDREVTNVNLINDPDAPVDALSCVEVVIATGTPNYSKVVRTYTLKDGSVEVVEIEEF